MVNYLTLMMDQYGHSSIGGSLLLSLENCNMPKIGIDHKAFKERIDGYFY